MTLHPEYQIESGTQASQLESTAVVLNIAGPNGATEGSKPPHKRANSLDIHEAKQRHGNSSAEVRAEHETFIGAYNRQ